MVSLPDLAYTFAHRPVAGQIQCFAETKCSNCPYVAAIVWVAPNNPHHIAKKFQRMGWDFDPYRAGRNLCPDCNPHFRPAKFSNKIPLPDCHKTAGERLSWLRSRLQKSRGDVAHAAHMDERLYRDLEDNRVRNFHDFHLAIAKVVPAIRRLGFAGVTLRWALGLPETGSVLGFNLKCAMQSKSTTTGFLATQTDIPPSAIEGLLNGALPNFYRLDEIAAALGTTADVLICDVAPLPKETKERFEKPAPLEPEPAPPPPPPEPVSLGVLARRLKTKREAEGLSQGKLAARIFPILDATAKTSSTQPISLGTVQVYLSKIEKGGEPVIRAPELLRACAQILNTDPDWQCGAGDEPESPPAPAPEPLPAWTVDLRNPDDVRRQLVALRADHVALADLHRDLLAEATTFKTFMDDVGGRIGVLEQVIARMSPETATEVAAIAEAAGVVAPILMALPTARQEQADGIAERMAEEADAEPAGGRINRLRDSIQNRFADILRPQKWADRIITLDELLSNGAAALVSHTANPRHAVYKLVQREAVAINGTLKTIEAGSWKLRQAILEAAE